MGETTGERVMFAFDNSYAKLPERFFARLRPTPVSKPRLVRLNEDLARELGLDPARLREPGGVAVLGGNRVPDGSEPLAMAYAGFQFGNWVPQLGDGRALLLGEIVGRDGVRRDIQLKGAGPTPFSRGGDGRAGLGPVLREYIVSEAMAALGIPTTRALAAVTTGDQIRRDTLLPGAVLTRVAQSHIRVGTFQFFAGRRDVEGLQALADHVIARHYPVVADDDNPPLALFRAVMERQAELVARWQLLGFIHGVMNTDNTSIAGETIDYGPCAFMDRYHPDTVFSSIDHWGRYAYGNQPSIAQWNLTSLAEALLPLFADEREAAIALARAELDAFPAKFEAVYHAGLLRKLGVVRPEAGDVALAEELLQTMADQLADFTLTFRRLADAVVPNDDAPDGPGELFEDPAAFEAWATKWRARLKAQERDPEETRSDMQSVNPLFIPRNHRVEQALDAAVNDGNFDLFEELLDVLASPYEDQPGRRRYMDPPRPEEVVTQTFCGT